MKLTVCLVTKGREKYLDQILGSLEPLLEDTNISVLIIDNGAPAKISERLAIWQSLHSKSVKIRRFELNESRSSLSWNIVREEGVDWAIFPSDDDEFHPEIVEAWRLALQRNPKLVGFATSAAIIKADGSLTGEILTPSAARHESGLDQLAAALHEPPFLWPSLFLRVSKIPKIVPNSRFVFDWWIGLNLLIAGEVYTSHLVGINYRVHMEQESYLAPLRRKYFEAEFWIDEFLRSQEFFTWASALSDVEKLTLWKKVMTNKPIYADPHCSQVPMASLRRVIMKSSSSSKVESEIVTRSALEQGVLLKDGDAKNLIYSSETDLNFIPGNLKIGFDKDVCTPVRHASNSLVGGNGDREIRIYCQHSSKGQNAIFVDCSKFVSNMPEINVDKIVNIITAHFEDNGDLELTLTSGERFVIQLLRKWRYRLPSRFRMVFRNKRSKSA